MLGKSLKHEIISTSRLFIPTYIVMLILALLGRLFTWLETRKAYVNSATDASSKMVHSFANISMILYMVALVAIFIMTFLFLIIHFYQDVFTDRGYLTMTLPVGTNTLVLSRILIAMLWSLLTSVIVIFSAYIIVSQYDEFMSSMKDMFKVLGDLQDNNPEMIKQSVGVSSVAGYVCELVLYLVLLLTKWYLAFYVSFAFGQLMMKAHPVGGSILSLVILLTVSKIIESLYKRFIIANPPQFLENAMVTQGQVMQYSLIGTMILNVIFGVIFFFLTTGIMKKHLNLD